jgi:hypothetical protein
MYQPQSYVPIGAKAVGVAQQFLNVAQNSLGPPMQPVMATYNTAYPQQQQQ